MDRVRDGLRVGELVGMVLTDFEIRDDELELQFEDARLVASLGDGELDVEVR